MTDTTYAAWVGRAASATDTFDPGPARRLAAVLDRDDLALSYGDPLPPGWQWLYFLAAPRSGDLTADGRGTRGDLLPAFEGLRRMWAGGRFDVRRPLRLGAAVTRTTTVDDIEAKEGRTGPLVIARLEHRYGEDLVEDQTLVFRGHGGSAPPPEPPPAEPLWRRTLVPDPVLLFRFSALTFNAHRIHYDEPYTRGIEGYPALLVHGPLTAILLLDLLDRNAPEARLARFDYRAVRPLFCGRALAVCGAPRPDGGILLWAEDDKGALAMRAEAILA
jgi:3-methylfumaryl-CoA hydratase